MKVCGNVLLSTIFLFFLFFLFFIFFILQYKANLESSGPYCFLCSCFSLLLQPALSVPIHVVELTNVPPELRKNTGSPMPKPTEARQTTPAGKAKVR